jgi:hypothetical protein
MSNSLLPRLGRAAYPVDTWQHLLDGRHLDLPFDSPHGKPQIAHLLPRDESVLTSTHRKPALHNATLNFFEYETTLYVDLYSKNFPGPPI